MALTNTIITTPTYYQIVLGNDVPASRIARAGRISIPNGSQTVTITFPTTLPGATTDYVPFVCMLNLIDAFSEDLTCKVTGLTLNSMTVTLNAPTDTGNYFISWSLMPGYNV